LAGYAEFFFEIALNIAYGLHTLTRLLFIRKSRNSVSGGVRGNAPQDRTQISKT